MILAEQYLTLSTSNKLAMLKYLSKFTAISNKMCKINTLVNMFISGLLHGKRAVWCLCGA